MPSSSSSPLKLGNKIRQARTDRGMRQADLAKLIGLSVQSISAFESGKIIPGLQHLEKIAYHTHRPVHFFSGQKVAEAMARIDQLVTELTELKQILGQVVEHE